MTEYAGMQFDIQWRQLVFPTDYSNPTPSGRYHLVVIGAGPAGLVAAIAAASLGARVALIEASAMGGDCLNVGCVPSKALLEITKSPDGSRADFETAFSWLREVRARIAHHDSVARYTQAGVDVYLGAASFVSARKISVAGIELDARRTLIATGARAALPSIPGLLDCAPQTNESIFDLQRLPARLAIIGAGPIGCEMAQAFARLGSKVSLIELAPRVLPAEHEDASRVVTAALHKSGVATYLSASISAVERQAGQVCVTTETDRVRADEILVATGRKANIDNLNLAGAGVETTANGLIRVDDRLRTSTPYIFAAGDVCSTEQFTHNADAHARVVVQNALFAPTASTKRLKIPHCTYTQPEIAQLGPHKTMLEATGREYDCYRVDFAELDRGAAQGDADGFAEVLTRRGSGEILGATIVGPDAGEQLAGICIAIKHGIGLSELAKTVLPYPTRSEYLKRLADAYNRTKLTPAIQGLMHRWFAWTA